LDREVSVVLEEVGEIAVDVERGKDVACVGVGVAGRSDETGERRVVPDTADEGVLDCSDSELGIGVVESEVPSVGSGTFPRPVLARGEIHC
jgi:hypothetical protein